METSAQRHEDTGSRKIVLLQDLVNCLDRERDSLLDLNVTRLWAVMEEKHSILQAIEELPDEATSVPSSQKGEMDRLKAEIRNRVMENRDFAQSSLALFDELITRIVGAAREEQTYSPPGSGHHAHKSPIYQRKA